MISPTMIPRPAEGTVHRMLGDETAILNVDDGHYYVLNQTATAIWERCDGAHNLQLIVDRLCDEFDVPPEHAWASLSRLMNDLVQARLVTLEVPSDET